MIKKTELIKRKQNAGFLAFCLILFFVFLLVIPAFGLIMRFNAADFSTLIGKEDFVQVLFQSILLSLCVSASSVILALIISILIREQKGKLKQVFVLCFTIPILIPTISIGMGLVHLFSNNGLISQTFGWNVRIFGFNGLLLGYILFTTPQAVLQIYDSLWYEDRHLHNEAKALQLNALSRLTAISLPRIKPAVKRAFLASFLLSFTDYGISLMVGGKYRILSLTLYQEIIGKMNFNRAAVIAIMLWVPLVILFFFCMKDSLYDFKHHERESDFAFYFRKKGRIISFVVLVIFVLFFLLPIFIFMASSFRLTNMNNPDRMQNFKSIINLNFPAYLKNSLIIAFCALITGTVVSCLSAYVTSKTKSIQSNILKFLAVVPFSIPGIVIGIGYAISYSSYSISGTYIPLICANVVHFFGIPYFMFLNTFSLMGQEIEITSKILRINLFNKLLYIYLPMIKHTIVESMMFYFVNSMITISAVVMLFRSRTMPLAILITQFEAQLLIYYAAAVTAIILIVNVVVKLIFYFLPIKNNI